MVILKSLLIAYKLNIQLPSDPEIAILGIYQEKWKLMLHKRNLYMNVHNSFIDSTCWSSG